MKTRVSAVIVASVSCMFLGGCVTSGTYQAKEQERQQVSRNLQETKNSYTELKEKFGKLEEANNEQSAGLKKLSAEAVEMKMENAKFAEANNEQSARLKKMSAEAEETRLENARLAEKTQKQSENLKMISAEFVELKLENAKLIEAIKPENILKTLAETITVQKQKIKTLTDENTKIRLKLISLPKMQPAESPLKKTAVDIEQQPVPLPPAIKKELAAAPVGKAPAGKSGIEAAPVPATGPELTFEPGGSAPGETGESAADPTAAPVKN